MTTPLEQSGHAPAEWVYGWDATPGIVSVWADRDGRALVWRRVRGALLREEARFRPWLFAQHLADLAHLGASLRRDDPRAPISYRELDGPPDAYRFLISARSGRALDQALLDGARRRLARDLRSLYDLDDYYRVGPVEQYLMSTGRVYFRDMVYGDLHRLQLDLETTDLEPERGRIFMVALRDTNGLELTLDAPEPEDERTLLAQLCRVVRERDPDVIENHNLFGFDLPFLIARAEALGVQLPLARPGAPQRIERLNEEQRGGRTRYRFSIPGRELLDTLDAVRRHDFVARDMPSHRLKEVARYFGVAGPERVYIPGAAIYPTYRANPELVRRYALDDVAEVAALSERLLAAPFALAGMAPRRYERVAYAGPAMGILEPMLVRAYLRAGQALPLPALARGQRTGGHTGGALFLFASGVARHVVKADIASLYPSLMRTFGIGPACDRLGALLGIVSHLLDARLSHKAAARSAAPGSLEAGHHHALQAAMKLIINSAYGYMGAVSMGLFADMDAADLVTSTGRTVLDQVIQAIRSHGMTLIEADTDGVFFATPHTWGSGRERELVAQVAAGLPGGINLEFEGRYAAMFSHEVKNYALLTYDGQLIMRGVAMRSSRSEPFGEAFLRGAMAHTLRGDIPALQRLFHETVASLRQRRLTPADVATRVRLSKTPAQYQASRQREGAYEALRNAGRTSWHPGERIRFYRAEGGRYVWLPDEEKAEVRRQKSEVPGSFEEKAESRRQKPEGRSQKPEVPGNAFGSHDTAVGSSDDLTLLTSAFTLPTYDAEHYVRVLIDNYADRLRKAFRPADFAQIFRADAQLGLFDTDIDTIEPLWIEAEEPG